MYRGGEGRERFHGGYSPRIEERERRSGWGVAPPSRNLWVGNLGPHVTQNLLSEQFVRFGDIENIVFIPGRSYAFVNYVKEEDAVIAHSGLQGFNIVGAPLRIEFAKGDKTSMSLEDEEYTPYTGGRRSMERGESHVRRDLRQQHPSPERPHDKSKVNKGSEPSEVLWVGLPSSLKVDEGSLRRAFSPFGEIDDITTFPGRNYAFVRYRSVVAACRAKESLQGKLFNNPRVNLSFAKSDAVPVDHGRDHGSGSMNAPNFRSSLNDQDVEFFLRERNFDSPIREFHMASPRSMRHMDRMSEDTNISGFGRSSSTRTRPVPGPNFRGTLEQYRNEGVGSERRMVGDFYEHRRISPAVDGPCHDLPPERPRRTLYEDSWGGDDGPFPLAKKLKPDSLPEKELPEYPFSDFEQQKHNAGLQKSFPSFLEQHHAHNKSFDSLPFGYRRAPDHSGDLSHSHAWSDDSSRKFDGFNSGPGPLPLNSVSIPNFNSEPKRTPIADEWKWEGTIAKGGTKVCRARCFPVGKVLDFMLPEILNCTARTGLDMLCKHYYQAEGTWVVFFVPETDSDIVYYNELLHYLGEKQRAAVAKLGDKITLFLVPPSEFSEQVLKVPGKVSISGVILKFQEPGARSDSLNYLPEVIDSKPPFLIHGQNVGTVFRDDAAFRKANSPDLRPYAQGHNYFGGSSILEAPTNSNFPQPGGNHSYSRPVLQMDKAPESHGESRQGPGQVQQQNFPMPSNWTGHVQISNSSTRNFSFPDPNASSHSFNNPVEEENPPENPRVQQGTTTMTYSPETSGYILSSSGIFPHQQQAKPQPPSTMTIPLHPGQLAQLAARLEQQKQLAKNTALTTDGNSSQPSLLQNPNSRPLGSGEAYTSHSQQLQQYSSTVSSGPFSQTQQLPAGLSSVLTSQVQQLQQNPSIVTTTHPVTNLAQQSSQQGPNTGREDTEADPQKRLQATLQLAAALLQQIQQQSKPTDQ